MSSEDCHVDRIEKSATEAEAQRQAVALLAVEGMGCVNCAARVRNSLIAVYGVLEADIALQIGLARVYFNPELVTTEDLLQAVARAGGDGRHEYRGRLIEAARIN